MLFRSKDADLPDIPVPTLFSPASTARFKYPIGRTYRYYAIDAVYVIGVSYARRSLWSPLLRHPPSRDYARKFWGTRSIASHSLHWLGIRRSAT